MNDWKVLEGSGGVHHGAHDLGGPTWAEGVLPSPNGPGAPSLKGPGRHPLGFPQNPKGGSTWGARFPPPPCAAGPRWVWGAGGPPQPTLPLYKEGRGQGADPNSSQHLWPPLSSSIRCSGLGEALQVFLLHHHHHAVVLLGFGGDLPHLRCPLERGEDGLHRHRTRDRVRKCCRIAAPGAIVYTNNEINLVGFGIFEG